MAIDFGEQSREPSPDTLSVLYGTGQSLVEGTQHRKSGMQPVSPGKLFRDSAAEIVEGPAGTAKLCQLFVGKAKE